jgi:hypothetical protein
MARVAAPHPLTERPSRVSSKRIRAAIRAAREVVCDVNAEIGPVGENRAAQSTQVLLALVLLELRALRRRQ